jgi:hypothetical protein
MLGLLLVIALALLIFGVIGGIAISKFLFFLLLIAGIIFLVGLFTRGTAGSKGGRAPPARPHPGPTVQARADPGSSSGFCA